MRRVHALASAALVAAVCAGCGPAPSQSASCVEGPWLDFAALACAGHSYCSANPAPGECALSDCAVRTVTFFAHDGTYTKTPVLLSAGSRQLSRAVTGTTANWAIEDGRLRMGQVVSDFECTDTRLLIGDAPYRARSDRPEEGLADALRQAHASGSWSGVRY